MSDVEQAAGPDYAGARVEIYTWGSCSYCMAAKRVLQKKGVTFVEHAIDGDDAARDAMMRRAGGRRTMPQIFIYGQPIGGYIELQRLEQMGQLDDLLAMPPAGTES